MADLTLINLNMLFLRQGEMVDRELHVPLGPLYLVSALEAQALRVDFRDYQTCSAADPFDLDAFLAFVGDDPAPVLGLSCMANLLPFTVLAARALRARFPGRRIILGGVGSSAVEASILARFPWFDVICSGEGESTGPELVKALLRGEDLAGVRGIFYRAGDCVLRTASRPRLTDLDRLPLPAFDRIDLPRYAGYGLMTSRGCPYPCTFCSVAPIWNHQSLSRSPQSIVAEMRRLHDAAGVTMFLFQDEFFVSGRQHVLDFCRELRRSGLRVTWKAFGRVNLTDVEMMKAMAAAGCVELRFGVESGSDAILARIKKGFCTADVLSVISRAIGILPRVDIFYVWGYPFETMHDFQQSLFQMVAFRSMGARILPSLLSLLPQTEIYQEYKGSAKLEFCPWLLPEFVFTGHEVCRGSTVEIPERYRSYFDLIQANPDVFPGFFHIDLAGNILPKLDLLAAFGFYGRAPKASDRSSETCGAHSPRVDVASNVT